MSILRHVTEDELVTTAEASEACGVNRRTVLRWIKRGRLRPVVTLPGKTGPHLFRKVDVLALKDGAE